MILPRGVPFIVCGCHRKILIFIHIALWKKLVVGERLHSIFPNIPPSRSVCGAREDVYHRIEVCPWLVVPVRVLDCTFLAVQSAYGHAPTGRLCSDYPKLSLTRAPGLLLWKTIRVLWLYRCDVRFRGTVPVPNISAFLRMLHSKVAKWLEMPQQSLAHQAVHLYMEGL